MVHANPDEFMNASNVWFTVSPNVLRSALVS
jgi:hypothetical protein